MARADGRDGGRDPRRRRLWHRSSSLGSIRPGCTAPGSATRPGVWRDVDRGSAVAAARAAAAVLHPPGLPAFQPAVGPPQAHRGGRLECRFLRAAGGRRGPLPTQPGRALLARLGRAVPAGLRGGDGPPDRSVVGSARGSRPTATRGGGSSRSRSAAGSRSIPGGMTARVEDLVESVLGLGLMLPADFLDRLWPAGRHRDSEQELRIRGSAPEAGWPCWMR